MSRIDDLIAESCPEGVEYLALGELGTFVRGSDLQKKDFTDSGIGCIHYGQIYTFYGTSTATTTSFVSPLLAASLRKARPGDLVIATTSENVEDVAKAVAWLGESEIAIGGHSCVFSHDLDPLYLAYYFQTGMFSNAKRKFAKGVKVKEVATHELARIRIPVPPREIQQEITQLLTKAESLVTGLEAELQLELGERRRQYEYYRDALFSFQHNGKARWVPMSEVGEFIRGRRFTKQDVVPTGIASIHYGEIYTHYGTSTTTTVSQVRPDLAPRLRFARSGDVVVAAVGETVEDVGKAVAWLGDGEVAVHDDCFVFRHSLNPKFVAYWLQTTALNGEKGKHVSRAKVKRLSGESLGKLTIPVPSPEEQARVVDILDHFNALVAELSASLSAELAVRRPQYEYYRDRLLTFEEAPA